MKPAISIEATHVLTEYFRNQKIDKSINGKFVFTNFDDNNDGVLVKYVDDFEEPNIDLGRFTFDLEITTSTQTKTTKAAIALFNHVVDRVYFQEYKGFKFAFHQPNDNPVIPFKAGNDGSKWKSMFSFNVSIGKK